MHYVLIGDEIRVFGLVTVLANTASVPIVVLINRGGDGAEGPVNIRHDP
jgi:hypothetical protein